MFYVVFFFFFIQIYNYTLKWKYVTHYDIKINYH